MYIHTQTHIKCTYCSDLKKQKLGLYRKSFSKLKRENSSNIKQF